MFSGGRTLLPESTSSGIFGGRRAHPDEFPHCVAVGSNSQFCCTGTLIAPQLVVTAAHCVAGNCAARVYSGLDSNHPIPEKIYSLRAVKVHPEFNSFSLENDLALLVLDRPIEGVTPCKIATSEQIAEAFFVRLAGYGYTEFGNFGIQMTVDVSVATTDCQSQHDNQLYGCHKNIEFVAGGNGVDSCNGDSGGPAYLFDGTQLLLAGATSRAATNSVSTCGDGGIYVRIDRYLGWIQDIAEQYSLDFMNESHTEPTPNH